MPPSKSCPGRNPGQAYLKLISQRALALKKDKTMDKADIENRFTYHAPKPGQPEIYEGIREQAKSMAFNLVGPCPESRELSLAITKLEECVFWANAAIARAK